MKNEKVVKAIELLEKAVTLLEAAGLSLAPPKEARGVRHVGTEANPTPSPM